MNTKNKVVIVGAGAAGLASAISAAVHGAEVYLVERNPHLGGWLGVAHAYSERTALCCAACSCCLVGAEIKFFLAIKDHQLNQQSPNPAL
ncbi:FAD-dependent oxidoreductase [bacterium]|nr:FAD-dependent oxidoreductase [bacterium]